MAVTFLLEYLFKPEGSLVPMYIDSSHFGKRKARLGTTLGSSTRPTAVRILSEKRVGDLIGFEI